MCFFHAFSNKNKTKQELDNLDLNLILMFAWDKQHKDV